jgi:RimJ/RimL family protein N-acetyltransferase
LWPDEDGSAELGYRLKRTEWGQGLACEGAKVLVGWGFEKPGYERITACTAAQNLASRRVMEKIGMTYLRTAKGEVWYRITQP